MDLMEEVSCNIAQALNEVESKNYQEAEENISNASEILETISLPDNELLMTIVWNQSKILEILSQLNSEKTAQQQQQQSSMKEAVLELDPPNRPSNVNIYGHIDDLAALSAQLAQDCVFKPSKVTFDDIIGLEYVKESLKDNIIDRFELPQVYGTDTDIYLLYLFYGPPGCSKSKCSEATIYEIEHRVKSVYSLAHDPALNGWQACKNK